MLRHFNFFWPKKITSDLNIFPEKLPDFVSVPFFALTFVMKLKDFDFKSYWNTLQFFDQKNGVRFEFALWKNVWFFSFPLCALTFVIKVIDLDFKLHWNTLIFFDQKNWRQIWICPMGKCLILFQFPCLPRLFWWIWEILTLTVNIFNCEIFCQIKICVTFFCLNLLYWHYYRNNFGI